MKLPSKKFIVIALGCIVVLGAFKTVRYFKTLVDVRKSLFTTFLVDETYTSENYNSSKYPDTTIVFKTTQEYKTVLMSPKGTAFPSAYQLRASVYNSDDYEELEFESNCMQLFGKQLKAKSVPMAYTYEDGTKKEFTFYSAPGLQAAFDKVYVKPTESFEGYSIRKLYNLTMKEYMHDFTKFMVAVMNNKPAFVKASSDYLLKAKTDKNFDVYLASARALNMVFPTDRSRQQFPNFEDHISSSTMGSLVRRQCDGTLPTMLKCLKTVLTDYDPEALKLINGQF